LAPALWHAPAYALSLGWQRLCRRFRPQIRVLLELSGRLFQHVDAATRVIVAGLPRPEERSERSIYLKRFPYKGGGFA